MVTNVTVTITEFCEWLISQCPFQTRAIIMMFKPIRTASDFSTLLHAVTGRTRFKSAENIWIC